MNKSCTVLHKLDFAWIWKMVKRNGWLVNADLTPRCLGAYIPFLSNRSCTGNLNEVSYLGGISSLDAFSSYSVARSCPAHALSDNRYTSGAAALFLSY